MTGGGIFGGSNKQTTSSTSEPWKGAQPTLKSSLSMANDVANDSSLWKPYTGSTVVPWDTQTKRGMEAITTNARRNASGGLTNQYQDVINQGGLNNAQMATMSGLQNIARGSGYNAEQQAALGNIKGLANSQYSITPELQAVLDQTGAQVANNVNLGASAAGRYGGGLHQGAVAKNVGEVTNNAILSDYNNFLGRRDAANNNLFQMGQAGLGNRMNAMTSASNLAQQGFGNLGTAYSGLNAPAQDLMTVGGMNEDLATRQMNDKLRIFNESQNLPKQRAEWLNAIGSGAGSLGSTQRESSPGQNPFLSALGYGQTGLGILGGFM